MDEVKAWLTGPRKYDEGAILYLQYGRDEALKRIFREPVSDYKRKKLEEALRSLLQKTTEVKAKVEVQKSVAVERVAVADRKWPKEKDATLNALHEQWKPKFAEMMNLMSRIYDVALAGKTDSAQKQEAGRMAHRILDLDDECDEIYRQRDFYLLHKKLPEEPRPMELVVDPIKIPLALTNCTRYVRDYKNILIKEPGNVKASAQLAKYEWAVSEYKKILKIE